MNLRMKAKLVCDVLTMSIWEHQPEAGWIAHSDQYVQQASDQYPRLLRLNSFVGSMIKQGCRWDNAVPESCFGNGKQERVH